MRPKPQIPALNCDLLRPGMRVAVACSGGADSVALLRILLEFRCQLGLVLSVTHVNHGLRGEESDADQSFVSDLATQHSLQFHLDRVDTRARSDSTRETIEEAARHLRYAFFRRILASRRADVVVTAHTMDDQAETVLHRFLRGAWTEGLGGIQPRLGEPDGAILRPFLYARRTEIESWLRSINQPWREDSSNRNLSFTRNRIRHELLPALASYNPQIAEQLARVASIARDEEDWWRAELARLLPNLLLPGKAVRGGGRSTSTLSGGESIAIEIPRLCGLNPAVARRVLRAAAAQLGCSMRFDETERLLAFCGLSESGTNRAGAAGKRLELEHGLRAERTPRELRLSLKKAISPEPAAMAPTPEYKLPVPGSIEAAALGLRVTAVLISPPHGTLPDAIVRTSRPGDRVRLRHSESLLKIKDAVKRILPSGRPDPSKLPLVEWRGEIVWVPGLDLESPSAAQAGLAITAEPLPDSGDRQD